MHTFRKDTEGYQIILKLDERVTFAMFHCPTIADAIAAVSMLNGGPPQCFTIAKAGEEGKTINRGAA